MILLLFALSAAVATSPPEKIPPYAELSAKVSGARPFVAFEARDAVSILLRAQRLEGSAFADCESWISALQFMPMNSRMMGGRIDASSFTRAEQEWEPWRPDDVDAIKDCDSFPCAVKFDAKEAKELAREVPTKRPERFRRLVEARIQRYSQTQVRKEYEFPGDPVDPWALLEGMGYRSTLARPKKPQIGFRIVDFAPGQYRPVRQAFDRRIAITKAEAAYWLRDVYNDHYFDGWGEWARLDCDVQAKKLFFVHVAVIELDTLKETDIISRMAYGRMREGVREKGGEYLTRFFDRLKAQTALGR